MDAAALTDSPVLDAGYGKWLERDMLPDWLIRTGIRRLVTERLREERAGGPEAQAQRLMLLIEEMRHSPIAIRPEAANAQHYEVPSEFYRLVLGPCLKYSSCLWDDPVANLEEAEAAMLALTRHRARLEDGQDVLELGCGWGSLSLSLAEHFPHSRIVAVSNSRVSEAAYRRRGEAAKTQQS